MSRVGRARRPQAGKGGEGEGAKRRQSRVHSGGPGAGRRSLVDGDGAGSGSVELAHRGTGSEIREIASFAR